MSLSLRESQGIDELAGVLYDMLPSSGNPRLSFPAVAQQLGLAGYWTGGSKRPAILTLLSATYERERHRFCPRRHMTCGDGRHKRQIVTDTQDLLLALLVHPADIQDCHGYQNAG